jgi:hypothetical protein
MKIPARAHHGHGFATFTAVVMISIVGTSLLALTLLFQADHERSMSQGAEVQLRQLLIAGAAAAVDAVGQDPQITGIQTLQTPADLDDAKLAITYQTIKPSVLRATVTTRIGDYKAIQILAFVATDTGWRLADAQLTRPY